MFRGVINSNGIPVKTDNRLTFPHHKTWPDSPLKRLGLLSGGFNGIKYNLNSRGYRCDEFINVHNKKHILFSGCSITAGHSIDIENSWSFLLHNYINSIYETSGYFNIAVSGQSISEIIFSIFKYCNEFGNPEEIYILYPDIDRESYITSSEKTKDYLIFNLHFLLEQYCISNNIKLITSSWALDNNISKYLIENSPKNTLNNFKTFFNLDQEDFENNINYDLQLVGNDGLHPGEGIHYSYFTFFKNIHSLINH